VNPEEMTPEQQDYDATYIAEGIDAMEKQTGLELSDESLDEVIDAMRANRGEDGAPLVEDVFNQFVADAEAEGTIEAADEAEEEALEAFEAGQANEPSAEQFAAMQRGDYGPELQRQALEAAAINPEPEGEQPNDWATEFQAQQIELEKRLGRGQTAEERAEGRETLTSKELKALADDAGTSDKPLDLIESYDRLFGSRNKEDRRVEAMAEAFDDLQNEGRDESNHAEPWETDEDFREPSMTNDDDRQAAMVATMKEGEAA
jgi:hypothetical protein